MGCGSSGEQHPHLENFKVGPKYNVTFNVKDGTVYHRQDTNASGDPFLKIQLGKKEKKTKVVLNTLNPKWEEEIPFKNVYEGEATVALLTLWDSDQNGDDLIGTARISLLKYKGKKDTKLTVPLYIGNLDEEAKVNLVVNVVPLGEEESKGPEEPDKSARSAREKEKEPTEKGAAEKERELVPKERELVPIEKSAPERERERAAVSPKIVPKPVSPMELEEEIEYTSPLGGEGAITTRALPEKPKKDVVLTIISGKVYHSHEILGKDDPFVKVKIGDQEQKTRYIDNNMEPTWNENLYFYNVTEEDAANAEVSIYDYDLVGPACFIGSSNITVVPYLGSKKHLTLPLSNKGKEEAKLELEAVMLEPGGAAREKALFDKEFQERIAAEEAAKKAAADKKIADKEAAERAKHDAKEKEKADKLAAEKEKADKKAAEKAAIEKEKADKAAAIEKEKADKIAAENAARERKLALPKKDVVLSIVSGKVYRSHETLGGKDDPFVKAVIGDQEQKTRYIDNNNEPTWNENLYFYNVTEEDAANTEVSIYDYDILGPANFIGSANISVVPYLNNKKHLTLPLFGKKSEEAKLELDAVMLEPGGAAREKAKCDKEFQERVAAEEAARKAAADKKIADKEAAERAKRDAKEKEKADKADAAAAEKAAKEKAAADKKAAEKAAADRKAAEKAAAEKEAADKKAAEKAKKEAAEREAALKIVTRDSAIKRAVDGKGNKKATIGVIRAEVFVKSDLIGKGDPYVVVQCGKEEQKTQACKGTQRPQWNDEFTFDHVLDANAQQVQLLLLDEDLRTKDDVLGGAKISLFDYVDNKTHVTIPVTDPKGNGKLIANLELDLMLETEDENGDTYGGRGKKAKEGERRAVVTVKNGKVYEKWDSVGKGDPYIKIILGCAEQNTSSKQNTQTPVWNEKLYFENISDADAKDVTVSIYDKESRKDTFIGTNKISIIANKNKKGPISVTLIDNKNKEQAKVELEVTYEVEML